VRIASCPCKTESMRTSEIKHLAERQPFRPFAVRLSNGAQYSFNEPRDFGAPRDFRMIFFFDENQALRIDTENIVEIFEQR
jgi:hypothetical protein